MSDAPDNTAVLARLISRDLLEMASIKRVDDALRVSTHCMYPSNGLVQVTVRGGVNTVVASDEGGAMGEALAAGIPMRDYDRQLAPLIKSQGVILKGGVISSPRMPVEAAPLAILLVANASQEIARHLYEHMRIPRTRDFKELLAAFLKEKFDERVSAAIIVGHSQKPHKFSNVISLPNGKRLIIDPVSHEPSSINARVVANLDVAAIKNPLIEQRIVYDDEDDGWSAADLNLLQVGALVVPFSRSAEVIGRIAHDQFLHRH
jgi:hypothetical protein